MTGSLVPLLESSEDELERALLLSARDDMPSRSGLQDTALALGLAAPAAKALADALLSAKAASAATASSATASSAALSATAPAAIGAAASVGSAATIAKFLVGGALVSFVSVATLDHVLTPSAAPVASQAQSKNRPVTPAPQLDDAPLAPLPRGGELVEATESPSSAPADVEHRKSASKRPSAPEAAAVSAPVAAAAPSNAAFAAPSSAAAPSNASLAAEIRLLDRTRAALAAGDAAGADRLLRSYDASRPSGVLSQEANLLRVRLLLAQGNRPAAAALARRIIAQHPESTHVESLRSLAAEQ
ncbi:MAG TPA: hypothetical protein VEQ58_15050 [Polyangiaceae bacterium]|nr:hypothetical protein [Polyangiaceae bacterium]